MNLEETYNIHKKINCIFPFFKSKFLCKRGIHNYLINSRISIFPRLYEEEGEFAKITTVIEYNRINETNLKCYCCGKEVELDEK
jgi:hypothetical protein